MLLIILHQVYKYNNPVQGLHCVRAKNIFDATHSKEKIFFVRWLFKVHSSLPVFVFWFYNSSSTSLFVGLAVGVRYQVPAS